MSNGEELITDQVFDFGLSSFSELNEEEMFSEPVTFCESCISNRVESDFAKMEQDFSNIAIEANAIAFHLENLGIVDEAGEEYDVLQKSNFINLKLNKNRKLGFNDLEKILNVGSQDKENILPKTDEDIMAGRHPLIAIRKAFKDLTYPQRTDNTQELQNSSTCMKNQPQPVKKPFPSFKEKLDDIQSLFPQEKMSIIKFEEKSSEVVIKSTKQKKKPTFSCFKSKLPVYKNVTTKLMHESSPLVPVPSKRKCLDTLVTTPSQQKPSRLLPLALVPLKVKRSENSQDSVGGTSLVKTHLLQTTDPQKNKTDVQKRMVSTSFLKRQNLF